MELLTLLNFSERTVHGQLRRILEKSGYFVAPQVPIKNVLRLERKSISKGDWNFIQNGSFDFVIYSEATSPVLAIEFDGPVHQEYERKMIQDVRKNRLCTLMGLPLLRISDCHIEEQEKTSILEFIVERIIHWYKESDERIAEMHKVLEEATPEEFEAWTDGGFIEPSIDPTVLFDIDHPFSGIKLIGDRLTKNFRISSMMLGGSKANSPLFEVGWKSQEHNLVHNLNSITTTLSLTPLTEEARSISVGAIFQARYEYDGWLAIDEEWDRSVHPAEWRKNKGQWPAVMDMLPGISQWELGEHIGVYRALKKVEDWSEVHLRESLTSSHFEQSS